MDSPERLQSEITQALSNALNRSGILYRLFSRVKSQTSVDRKTSSDNEYGNSKLIQDIIGVRIVVYFVDDINAVREITSSIYSERAGDASIDKFNENEFRAKRFNIVYDYGDRSSCPLKRVFGDFVDSTFELQIRTIFSEGWHEVDHDFRYKFRSDWDGFSDLSRGINGVLASLETNEWTIIRILDDLSYENYKSKNFVTMMRQKLRMRIISYEIEAPLFQIVTANRALKRFSRVNRAQLLQDIHVVEFSYPLNLTNLIYFINLSQLHIPEITELIPPPFLEEISSDLQKFRASGPTELDVAQAIAYSAHRGQKRFNGEPYLSHPEAVSAKMSNEKEKCVAWLHDVLEDSETSSESLLKKGISADVVQSILALSKQDKESYAEYIERVRRDPIARKVKIHDILHNLSDNPKGTSIHKYLQALDILLSNYE